MLVKPVMIYCLEMGALTKRKEAKLEVPEIIRFVIRKENISTTAQAERFGNKVREGHAEEG